MSDGEKKEAATEEKKEKKAKEKKPPEKINVKSQKANPKHPIDPRTGTRFAPETARQVAFEIVYSMAKDGKSVKEIREKLKNTRKDNGGKFNLDTGYINYVVACHPEMFEVYDDGTVKILKHPTVDPEAAKKFEEEKEAQKKKAAAAREERRKKAEEKKSDGEKKEKKSDGEKKEKKEKKED